MTRPGPNRSVPPLDKAALERLALRYVERYATTRAKLAAYLARKLRERGWRDEQAPPTEALVARFAELGYVDDGQFARMKGEALTRRGYGLRRVELALKIAGIQPEDARPALDQAEDAAFSAALAYARRRRLGPFGEGAADPARSRREFAAMIRAGHPFELAKKILNSDPDEINYFQNC